MRRKSLTAMFVAVATLLPTLARAETTEIRCQDIEDSNRTMFKDYCVVPGSSISSYNLTFAV